MADRIDVSALLASVDLVAVVGSHVPLKKVGHEFVGQCQSGEHIDNNPSMYVSPAKGFVHCFSCGWNANAIGFIERVEGVDFLKACAILGAPEREWKPSIIQRPRPPTVERITSKPPPDAGLPNMAMRELGEPAAVRAFHDADGWVIGYEARYDLGSNGSRTKQIRMFTWGRRGDGPEGWACGHFTRPGRPLYNMHLLKQRPLDPVCITEGPKKADAGAVLLPQYVHVSLQGGAQGAKHVDFAPLAGRRLLLWPDADEVGRECMAGLARLLSDPDGLACDPVKLVDVSDWADGRDLADCLADGWTPEKVMEWAGPRVRVYQPMPLEAEPEPVAPSEPEPPPESEFPPEATAAKPKRTRKPRLSVVGNAALAPEADAEPLPVPLSEDAIADAFAAAQCDTWRYVAKWGQWLQWLGQRWQEDEKRLIDRLAVEQCRIAVTWPEAAALTAEGRKKLGQRRFAGAVRDLAMSDRRIAAITGQWDKDIALLGMPEGIWDCALGKMIAPDVEQYITKATSVSPAPGKPELWLKFIDTITGGDADLIAYLQRAAGYSLTGETREQCLFFLYGTGQNGKGVFLSTLRGILGDYAKTCDADVFMDTGPQRHTTELARLRGARFVSIDETDQGCRFNEKRIKRLTGGGEIEARLMAQDNFEFMPQFKLWFAGNHKPQLRGVGKAMQRRLQLIPFTVTIADEDRDDKLADKLREEYPQILRWMLDGMAAWKDYGLAPPELVRDATAEYIEGQDTIGEWLESNTERKDRCLRPGAYKNYHSWMSERGEKAWSSKAWWEALEQKGFTLQKSMGQMYVLGLRLRTVESDREPPSSYFSGSAD